MIQIYQNFAAIGCLVDYARTHKRFFGISKVVPFSIRFSTVEGGDPVDLNFGHHTPPRPPRKLHILKLSSLFTGTLNPSNLVICSIKSSNSGHCFRHGPAIYVWRNRKRQSNDRYGPISGK